MKAATTSGGSKSRISSSVSSSTGGAAAAFDGAGGLRCLTGLAVHGSGSPVGEAHLVLQHVQGHRTEPEHEVVESPQVEELAEFGYALGFSHMASGPLVRSSYHADVSAHEAGVV